MRRKRNEYDYRHENENPPWFEPLAGLIGGQNHSQRSLRKSDRLKPHTFESEKMYETQSQDGGVITGRGGDSPRGNREMVLMERLLYRTPTP